LASVAIGALIGLLSLAIPVLPTARSEIVELLRAVATRSVLRP